jgi:uncharacterized protein YciI
MLQQIYKTMKHFIVLINYTAPLEKIEEVRPKHREFLQIGYDIGFLLLSGTKNPRTGGVVAARAESLEELQLLFSKDPFKVNNIAEYEYIEFEPAQHQPFLDDWIKKEIR